MEGTARANPVGAFFAVTKVDLLEPLRVLSARDATRDKAIEALKKRQPVHEVRYWDGAVDPSLCTHLYMCRVYVAAPGAARLSLLIISNVRLRTSTALKLLCA